MRTFEITQEQILQIHNSGKIDLKRWFPEAFETKLEVGKWYKEPSLNGRKFRFLCLQKIDGSGYGFDSFGDWQDYLYYCNIKEWQEANPEEVETALITEARKRGYKTGVFCEFGIAKDIREIEGLLYKYKENRNCLYIGNDEIFRNGKWSPIIETITKAEAEKILNKKIV